MTDHVISSITKTLLFCNNYITCVSYIHPQDGSSNGGNVMETVDPLYQKSMGQKVGMSYYDALTINMAYCKGKLNNYRRWACPTTMP